MGDQKTNQQGLVEVLRLCSEVKQFLSHSVFRSQDSTDGEGEVKGLCWKTRISDRLLPAV